MPGSSQRHLALPLERYWELEGFGEANDEFIRVATELGSHAVTKVLAAAGLTPRDVDLIMSTTITGLAVPSIEARVAAEIGLRDDVKRVPLVGLGCVAGAAGVARVHDYLLGHPDDVAVLLSVELCSLTVQRDDRSVANLVASGLFGDGAAAVVMVGADRAAAPGAGQPRVVATRSRLYPETERAMGWDVGATGLRIVLGAEVPDLVRANVRDDVDRFLADAGPDPRRHRLVGRPPRRPQGARGDAGGARGRPRGARRHVALASTGSATSARPRCSTSSPTPSPTTPPEPGSWGVLMAMGPGFCLELVLLRAAD